MLRSVRWVNDLAIDSKHIFAICSSLEDIDTGRRVDLYTFKVVVDTSRSCGLSRFFLKWCLLY